MARTFSSPFYVLAFSCVVFCNQIWLAILVLFAYLLKQKGMLEKSKFRKLWSFPEVRKQLFLLFIVHAGHTSWAALYGK